MPKPPKRAARKAAAAAQHDAQGEPSARTVGEDAPRKKTAAKKIASGKAIAKKDANRKTVAKTASVKKASAKKAGSKKIGAAKIAPGTGRATEATARKTVHRAVRSGGAVMRTATLDGATAGVLDRLFDVVTLRRDADPNISHSARLLSRGTAKVAQKFGEEAVECLIEAVAGNSAKLIGESADVLYHLIVMWVDAGVHPNEIWLELQRREGTSGIAEKMSRGTAAHMTGE